MATAQKLQTEALVVEKAKDDFKLITVTVDPVLRSDEVLVEMKYSGVCHTVSGALRVDFEWERTTDQDNNIRTLYFNVDWFLR